MPPGVRPAERNGRTTRMAFICRVIGIKQYAFDFLFRQVMLRDVLNIAIGFIVQIPDDIRDCHAAPVDQDKDHCRCNLLHGEGESQERVREYLLVVFPNSAFFRPETGPQIFDALI